MSKYYLLSEQDHKLVQEMLVAARSKFINQRSRTPIEIPRTHQGLGGYIALPPSTGIPALTNGGSGTAAGTGTSAEELDRPGYTNCSIYQIIVNATTGIPELVSISNFVEKVYNLSDSAIAFNWVQIQRDKFGNWLAIPSQTASSSTAIKRGKLATTLNSGSRQFIDSATVHIWTFNGTVWSDSGLTETVYDDGMVPSASAPLPVGTWIQLVQIGSYWFYDGHNCDPQSGTGS